jgi:hypothetical protein
VEVISFGCLGEHCHELDMLSLLVFWGTEEQLYGYGQYVLVICILDTIENSPEVVFTLLCSMSIRNVANRLFPRKVPANTSFQKVLLSPLRHVFDLEISQTSTHDHGPTGVWGY